MACHVTVAERDRIAQLHHQGRSQQEIAEALARHPATISRELRRNASGGVYHAAQAQDRAQRRRRERPLVRKVDRAGWHCWLVQQCFPSHHLAV